jgi:hypothetical protein
VLALLFAAFLAPKRPSSPRRDMPILDRSPASVDSAATSLTFKRISSTEGTSYTEGGAADIAA